jgi:hypothetical protein
MRIYPVPAGLHIVVPMIWRDDWAWGMALIVLTVVIHVIGLGLINQAVDRAFHNMGTLTLLVTSLHALEASIWAASYWLLGALPEYKFAMLYSLNALTSYGHENLTLEHRWQLMGAIEALNGWLLFGLTTAFLFGMMEKVGLLSSKSPKG